MTGLNYAAGGEASLVVVVRQGRALNLAAPCRVGEPVLGEIHPVGLAPCAARKPHGSRCGDPTHHPLRLTLIHHQWTPMPLSLSRNLAVRCQRMVRPVLLHLWFPSAEDAPSNKPRTHTFATIPKLIRSGEGESPNRIWRGKFKGLPTAIPSQVNLNESVAENAAIELEKCEKQRQKIAAKQQRSLKNHKCFKINNLIQSHNRKASTTTTSMHTPSPRCPSGPVKPTGNRIVVIPRKHLDIGLTDLIYAVASCLKREDRHKKTKPIITLTAYFLGIQDLKSRHQKPILPLELGLKGNSYQ